MQAECGDAKGNAGTDGELDDVSGAKSSAQIALDRVKRKAWEECSGMSRAEACRQYIETLNKEEPNWSNSAVS